MGYALYRGAAFTTNKTRGFGEAHPASAQEERREERRLRREKRRGEERRWRGERRGGRNKQKNLRRAPT